MPRRNRRRRRSPSTPTAPTRSRPDLTPEQMARNLVARGLRSPQILGPGDGGMWTQRPRRDTRWEERPN